MKFLEEIGDKNDTLCFVAYSNSLAMQAYYL